MANNVKAVPSDFYGYEIEFPVDARLIEGKNKVTAELQALKKTSNRIKGTIGILGLGAGSTVTSGFSAGVEGLPKALMLIAGVVSGISSCILYKFPLARKKEEILQKESELRGINIRICQAVEAEKKQLADKIIQKTPSDIQREMRGGLTQLTQEEITDIYNQMQILRLEEIGKRRAELLEWMNTNGPFCLERDALSNAEREYDDLGREAAQINQDRSQAPSLIIVRPSQDAGALMEALGIEEKRD